MRCLLLLSLAALLSGNHPSDAAESTMPDIRLTVHESARHYDVYAVEIEQLLRELRVPGRQLGSGVHAHGLTTTELNLRRETGQRGGQCRLERLELDLGITVTTPRWASGRALPKSLQTDWPRILKLIEEHEDGHRQNALNAARWLHRRIIDELSDWQPCSLLAAKLSRYVAASQTRRGLQDALLDSRAAARSELTRTIRHVRFQRARPDWMQ